ncbi:hypothetical protein PsYK624_124370 [Phanerochaete sordida]|uniref:F-box domain-containing protein n=1 Tax=Phanerochaete sordida TaxID=48140 RepID=A0A9P3GHV5_9APHY|nr:hypothetical protein PsYK624_124370 [Phanerochaete sordida]
MHHCLQIDEILHHIAQYADGSLVDMALVCHAFYEPAMTLLWRELSGLRPLFACLPAHTFRYDEDDALCMVRDPTPNEWTRFRHHAPRVRGLTLIELDFMGEERSMDYNCLDALKASHPPGPILPNLMRLHILDKNAMQYAPLFVQPSLQIVEGTYTAWGELDTIAYLRAIAERTVALRQIVFTDMDDPGTLGMETELSRVLRNSQSLTNVSLDANILPKALVHLGVLPNLTRLRFDLNNVDYRSILSGTPQPKFRSLVVLEVSTSAQHVAPVVGLLESISPQELRSLTVNLRLFHEDEEQGEEFVRYIPPTARSLQRIISTLTSFKALRRLVIAPWGYPSHLPDHIVSGDALRPLLELPHLVALQLPRVPFALTAHDIECMAKAWPALTTLQLGNEARHNVVSVRPPDLLPLAAYCPDLRDLGLQLLCEEEDVPSDGRPAEGFPTSRLRDLRLGENTVIEDAAPLAAFLSDVFPKAEVKHNYYSFEDEPAEWAAQIEEVQRLKGMFAAVRAQERRAAARKYADVPASLDVSDTEGEDDL